MVLGRIAIQGQDDKRQDLIEEEFVLFVGEMDRHLRLPLRPFHNFRFAIDTREEDIEQMVFVCIENSMGYRMNGDIEDAFIGLDRIVIWRLLDKFLIGCTPGLRQRSCRRGRSR